MLLEPVVENVSLLLAGQLFLLAVGVLVSLDPGATAFI